MKILIDCRFWGPTHTGLGVYTRQLAMGLAKIDRQTQYVLLVRPEVVTEVSLPTNFRLLPVDISAYSVKEQLVLPWLILREHPDLVHFPSINIPVFYPGRFVCTVHDLIKHQSRGPETSTRQPWAYWVKYALYLLVFGQAVWRSQKILVPSETVRQTVLDRYRLPSAKVIVTYEAPALTPDKETGTLLNLPEKFGIYTGNSYPHKNLPRLLRAWKLVYEKTGALLLISSGRNIFSQKIEALIVSLGASGWVKYLGYLPDGELVAAYRRARVYVFPTLLEGFGIPGLDAMSFGLPVVCSGIPVLREVYGPAAVYFDPENEEDMAAKICQAITDKKLRDRLIANGRKQAGKYSWDKLARQTRGVYEGCLGL